MKQPPPPTRSAAAGVIVLGLGFLGLNHLAVVYGDRLFPMVIMAGAVLVVLGLGGLVDPRLMSTRRPAASSRSAAVAQTGRPRMGIGASILFILGLGLWFYIWKYVY
jgi:hypothetical protein